MRSWHIVEQLDEFTVEARVHQVGEDLLVVLWGGSRPHIGAVGLAEPRPSLKDPQRTSATSSVFTFAGHREDSLAKDLAEELARRLGRRVVVSAGMHWEGLTPEGIAKVTALCGRFAARIVENQHLPAGEGEKTGGI